MRYSIMLQLVAGTTVVLVGAAALFAWLQNREPIQISRDASLPHLVLPNQFLI